MQLTIIVPGQAVAKQSARFANMGGFIKSYQKASVVNYANYVRLTFLQQYPDHKPEVFKGKMLEVYITEYRMIPSSKPKKFHQRALEGSLRPITKPDLDNVSKNILDALNKVVFMDDSQIVKLQVEKYYAMTPRVEITVKEINENEENQDG